MKRRYLHPSIAAAVIASVALANAAEISGDGVEVVDGDTFNLGPVTIRLHGIDAPEAGQQCERQDGRSWQCGTEATNRLAELVEGRTIKCMALDRDAYGRIIATCTAGDVDLNAAMMREGLAFAFTRFSDDYAALQTDAQAEGVGIWAGTVEAPWDYRANKWERAAAASPRAGCPIKGNISADDERIYHTPWSPWYGRTKISEANGEQWFCDEAEAQAAGWRAARWR